MKYFNCNECIYLVEAKNQLKELNKLREIFFLQDGQ